MCSFKIPCYAAGLLFTFRNNRSSICTAFDCGIAIGGITIPQNPSNTFSSACHSCSILAIKNTDLSICVSRNCTRTRSARDSTRSGNILYRCPADQFLKQTGVGTAAGNIQRHGVAVAVKGSGKVAGIGLGDNDILRQRIAAAGDHILEAIRIVDGCRRTVRAAAAGRPGHRHFLSRLLLLLRLLIPGRDGVLRVHRSYLFLLGLLLLIRGQHVGQHGGGQQADNHHDGQQPAYDSLLHVSFSFM